MVTVLPTRRQDLDRVVVRTDFPKDCRETLRVADVAHEGGIHLRVPSRKWIEDALRLSFSWSRLAPAECGQTRRKLWIFRGLRSVVGAVRGVRSCYSVEDGVEWDVSHPQLG